MKSLAVVAAAVVIAAMLAATASAKQIDKVVICGSSACSTVTGTQSHLLLLTGGPNDEQIPPRGHAAAGPYFTAQVFVHDGAQHNSWKLAYMPKDGTARSLPPMGPAIWWKLSPAEVAAFEDAAAGLQPFGAGADRHSPGWRVVHSDFVLWALVAVGALAVAGSAAGFAARRRRLEPALRAK